MSRRERTERKILEALEQQIREAGMGAIGINAVAKRAGVSKELIYRYFGGMSGLLLAWMQEQDFWTSHPHLLAEEQSSRRSPSALVLSMLRAQIDALANNVTLREVRRWELVETNEVTAQLASRREQAARSFIERLDDVAPEIDLPAVVSIMLAGVLYLMLRSKTESHFLGIPLRTEEGWDRLYAALEHIVAAFPEELTQESLATLEARRSTEKSAGEPTGKTPQ